MMAAPPDVLRWSPRSEGHGDCAVAAIELACGVTYETALAAACSTCPSVLQEGLSWSEIRRAIHTLGYKTSLRRRYTLDEETGILNVYRIDHVETSSHVVYLWEGRIIEPMDARRQLWLDADQFLHHYRYQAGSLLVISRPEGV